MAGSLGAVYSQIINNHIYNIWTKRQFTGAEMAGIKLHGAIDVLIKNNRLHNTGRGLWMDWMAQGTRITGNLLYDNSTEDLFVEVDHGPFLVDNNLFLSGISLNDMSEGGAYVHNLMTGGIASRPELSRFTPYHHAHSTTVAGLSNTRGGDNRFYNNIFVGGADTASPNTRDSKTQRVFGFGLWVYDTRELPLQTGGNVYFNGARPYSKEIGPLNLSSVDPKPRIAEQADGVYLHLTLPPSVRKTTTQRVTTALLGKAKIPGLAYENADGSPVTIDYDYFGKKRTEAAPCPGPFADPGQGNLKLKVW
jgi:hypothetical protein